MAASAPSVARSATAPCARRRQTWQPAPGCPVLRRRCLVLRRTSEHWWEDELEYDAVTELLQPKLVVLATPEQARARLGQLRDNTAFVTAFASPEVAADAEQLWEALGRTGPPLFLKVRTRESLRSCGEQAAAGDSQAAEAAACEFWAELAGQSWRTALDAGLDRAATLAKDMEQLLVLAGSAAACDCLLAAALGGGGSSSSQVSGGGGAWAVLQLDGWNEGLAVEAQQRLERFSQLRPRLAQLAGSEAAAAAAASAEA